MRISHGNGPDGNTQSLGEDVNEEMALDSQEVIVRMVASGIGPVLPHLLVPRLRAALAASSARVVVVLNLEPQPGETDGFSPEEPLTVLRSHLRGVALHTVIADEESVVDRCGLLSAVRGCGAELVLAPVAEDGGVPRHDPARLAGALRQALGTRQGMDEREPVPQPHVPDPVRGGDEGNAAHGAG